MSEREKAEVTDQSAMPMTVTHPGHVKAAGDVVMRAIAGLDPASQVAVLEWARMEVLRRVGARQERADCHAVSRGEYDAEIRQWTADGCSQRFMALQLGCSRVAISIRMRLLSRRAR